jgi:hypothetical protein
VLPLPSWSVTAHRGSAAPISSAGTSPTSSSHVVSSSRPPLCFGAIPVKIGAWEADLATHRRTSGRAPPHTGGLPPPEPLEPRTPPDPVWMVQIEPYPKSNIKIPVNQVPSMVIIQKSPCSF